MYRSLGSKARMFLYMRIQLRMDVSNPTRAKQYTCSFQCLPHLCSCHSADFAGWKAGYVLCLATVTGKGEATQWVRKSLQELVLAASPAAKSHFFYASAIYVVGNHNFGSPLRVLVLWAVLQGFLKHTRAPWGSGSLAPFCGWVDTYREEEQ